MRQRPAGRETCLGMRDTCCGVAARSMGWLTPIGSLNLSQGDTPILQIRVPRRCIPTFDPRQYSRRGRSVLLGVATPDYNHMTLCRFYTRIPMGDVCEALAQFSRQAEQSLYVWLPSRLKCTHCYKDSEELKFIAPIGCTACSPFQCNCPSSKSRINSLSSLYSRFASTG